MKKKTFGRITFIPGRNGGRYPYCHSLFIDDDVKAVIDPASDEGALLDIREKRGVDVVINSHYHEDHMMYNYLFPDAELWVPEKDGPAFSSEDTFIEWYNLPSKEYVDKWRGILRNQFNFKERTPSRLLKDRDMLDFGNTKVQVVHTPGHTWGHSCFFFPGEEIMFLADMDLTRFGPWYGDVVSDIDDFIASVERVRRYPARIFITGHEHGIFEAPIEDLFDKYLAVIEDRERKLLDLLKQPRTMEDIVNARIVYKKPREPAEYYYFGEWAIMGKHLERLIKRGTVIEENGRYSLIG